MDETLIAARRLLNDLTPLNGDCGRFCGAVCCAPLEGEDTRMLLFPGEEAEYSGKPGWKLRKTEAGEYLLLCSGSCPREDRPLSCRIFPLLPILSDTGIKVEKDLRAMAVCPLSRQPLSALNPAFVDAVRKAGEMLSAVPAHRQFLLRRSAEQEELRALRRALGKR